MNDVVFSHVGPGTDYGVCHDLCAAVDNGMVADRNNRANLGVDCTLVVGLMRAVESIIKSHIINSSNNIRLTLGQYCINATIYAFDFPTNLLGV